MALGPSDITPTGVSPSHYVAIGKIAANWAALEALVNSSIWQLAEMPDEIGVCLTAQIFTFDGKIKALVSLARLRGVSQEDIDALNKFHGDGAEIAAARNRAVHDPWIGDAKTGTPHRLEISANKMMKLRYIPVPTADLNKTIEQIVAYYERFENLIGPILSKYPPLPRKSF